MIDGKWSLLRAKANKLLKAPWTGNPDSPWGKAGYKVTRQKDNSSKVSCSGQARSSVCVKEKQCYQR